MGLGDFLSGILGTNNDFQAQSPYTSADVTSQSQQQQGLYGQQQQLAQALMAQSQGQGPNPALSQLRQTTDQNSQLASGLLASQRGLNPALAARMAAQQQTTANQQAGGQAATLSAQQQLGAQGQLSGLYGQMGSQNLQQQGLMNQSLMGAQAINANVASGNQQVNAGIAGGLMNAVGSAGGAVSGGKWQGGRIQGYAGGGMVGGGSPPFMGVGSYTGSPQAGAYNSLLDSAMGLSGAITGAGTLPAMSPAVQALGGGIAEAGGKGFRDFVSGLKDTGTSMAGGDAGDMGGFAAMASEGGQVAGKANVPGDSPKNDTVPTMLSPGELVIPRSHAQNASDAKAFIDALMAKEKKKAGPQGYAAVIAAHRELGKALQAVK